MFDKYLNKIYRKLNNKTKKNIIEEDIKFTQNSVQFYVKNNSVISFYFVNRKDKKIIQIPFKNKLLWSIAELDIRLLNYSGYTDFYYKVGEKKIKFGGGVKRKIKVEKDRILHIFKKLNNYFESDSVPVKKDLSLIFQITYTRKSISSNFRNINLSSSFINQINYAKTIKLLKKGNKLKIYGEAFISGINSIEIKKAKILVIGRQYFDEYYFPLKLKKSIRITKKYGFNNYNYDYSGFVCEFNLEDLIKKSAKNSHWDLYIELIDNKENIYLKRLSGLPRNNEGDEVLVFKKINSGIEYLIYFTFRDLHLSITQRDITNYETYFHKIKEILSVIIYKTGLIRNFDESVLIGEYLSERAQDNGFYFFKYLCEKKPHIKCHYVIKKNSPDIKNLAKYSKKLVYYFSFKHLLLLLSCKAIISSQGREHLYIFKPKKGIFKNAILEKPFIFLQHGVIGFKKIGGFKKGGINTANYIVASNQVEKNIIKDQFLYKEEEIILTGLARYDELLDKSSQSNSILIMPTWRSWLFSLKDEDFLLSDFYKSYNSLLKNKNLVDFTIENNIELIFFGHMKMFKFMQLFEFQNLKFIKPGEKDINQLLMESKVLVTDYSSVAWDFHYMKKPVCFYHFDQEKFLETHGSYLNLNTDIFGNVIKTEDKLVDKIIESYLNKKNKIIKKVFFEYNDKRNSERIFENIKNYLGWH